MSLLVCILHYSMKCLTNTRHKKQKKQQTTQKDGNKQAMADHACIPSEK